jgi:hypothetical protein
MATIANLNIMLGLEDHVTKGLERTQRNVEKLGSSFRAWGGGLTAGVTAPVLGLAAVSVSAASDLQESMSAVQAVYDGAADTVIQRATEAAKAVGLSQQEYLATSAVLGVYGDTLGLTSAETAEFSNSLIQGAADLGSFYNASTPEVLEAMQSALRGEFDPLERFGIMMNQASLEQYALEQGIWDGTGALTAQQRILAAQGFILDNMGDATGDFARTSGGLANTMKILRAQLKNVAAQMGQVLLPAITKVSKIFGDLLTRFQAMNPRWQRWIVMIALVAAGIGPLLIVLGTFLTLLPAIGAALAVLTGPIGLVIAAIALLTAAYIGNWWGFRDAVDGVAGAAQDAVHWLGEFEAVRSTASSALDAITGLFDRVTDSIGKTGRAILSGDWRTALEGIGDFLSAPAKSIGEFFRGIETGFEPVDRVFKLAGGTIVDFGRIIQEVFQGDFSGALDVLQRIGDRVKTAFVDAFNAIPWGTIGDTISTNIQELPGKVADLTTLLLAKGEELLLGFLNGLDGSLPSLTQWLNGLGAKALEAVGPLATTLVISGAELIGGLVSGIQEKLPALESKLGELPGIITSHSGAVLQAGWDIVWAIGEGMIDGIQGIWNSVVSFAKDLARAAYEEAKGWLGINSPSRMFAGIGAGIGEGLVLGMERSLPSVTRAAGAMASATNIRGMSGSDSYGSGSYGVNTTYQNNYGTVIQEAPRHPSEAIDSYSISRSRA